MINIPNELRSYKQWVNYKLVKKTLKDGTVKYTKPPCDTNGKLISINDVNNFNNFETTKKAIGKGGIEGIGFVFTDNDNFIGVDLDNVIIDGEMSKEATNIMRSLDSYTELSVSKKGIHIICKGSFNQLKNRKGSIEIYNKDRYFTMTGDIVGEQRAVQERSLELQELHDKYLLESIININTIKYTQQKKINKTDSKYLSDGLKYGKRLGLLMGGYRGSNDESMNDYNLLQELAYWSNCNVDLMKRAFYYSNLFQTKDEFHKNKAYTGYLDRTIQSVIKNQRRTAKEC